MRIASWIFVVCTIASAVGVFLPAVELRVGGLAIDRRATLSLYQASNNRAFVRKVVVGYQHSSGQRVGGALISVLAPRATGRLKGYVDDAHDAMDTIGGVSDDDAKTLGTILAITMWGFLLLHALMAGLVGSDVISGTYHRRRIIAALATSVVVTAIALAIHWICGEAVFEANDEIGRNAIGVGAAAFVIPIASVVGLVDVIAVLVLHIRSTRPA